MGETISGMHSCYEYKATSHPLQHMNIRKGRCHFQMGIVSSQQYSGPDNSGDIRKVMKGV